MHESLRAIVEAGRGKGRERFQGIEARATSPESFEIRIEGKAGRNLARLIAFFETLPEGLDSAGEGEGAFGRGLSLPAVLDFLAQGLWGNGPEWKAEEMARFRIDLLPEGEREAKREALERIPWE